MVVIICVGSGLFFDGNWDGLVVGFYVVFVVGIFVV